MYRMSFELRLGDWMLSVFCFFKQKTAYEMRMSDWSSDVCSSDLTDKTRIILFCDVERPMRFAWIATLNRVVARTLLSGGRAPNREGDQIGRASCRERVCQYV